MKGGAKECKMIAEPVSPKQYIEKCPTKNCKILSAAKQFSDGALDVKQIEMILAEMERRGINDPSRSSEEAWNEFEQEYSGKISDYADCALMRRLVLQ